MASGASLVQDVFLGFEPRLRGRRLAPWGAPAVRLLFQLDVGETLDDPDVGAFLEALAERIEIVAWQPRPGALGPDAIEQLQRLARDGGRRFGESRVLVGGRGLSAWLALAAAPTAGIAGAVAIAPALAHAGPAAPQPSALRTALAAALARTPLERPALVVEARERPQAEARVVDEWLAQAPRAARLVVPGKDADLLGRAWARVIASWAAAVAPEEP